MKDEASAADETLDLRGVPCPRNASLALLCLMGMERGRVLVVLLDDGEPMENVPRSLEEEGYPVETREPIDPGGPGWRLHVRCA